MPNQAKPTEYLVPEPWTTPDGRGLNLRIGTDKDGYFAYSEVRKLPDVVEYEGRLYRRTGWNSDTGTVCYKETPKSLLARPAHEGLGDRAICEVCGDAAQGKGR